MDRGELKMKKFFKWLFFWNSIHRPIRFDKWAFGGESRFYEYNLELINTWNKRHGDKLLISMNDEIQDSIAKMRELYKKEVLKK